MIMTIEVDKCGVDPKPPKTSLDSLKELPEPPLKPKVEKLEKKPDMSSVDKDADLESTYSRV